ncbi:protein binding protein, putative [Ricinus communis]|uniref:Protein binding protein, putative n=1 Tax=Ricinus communis TaxID=3988 RepID=B9S922_RICCO|nr:protein binding protein, putative [Ricinus communis]
MESYRQDKIQKFEEFVDRRLKPDLVRAIAQRDKVFEEQKVFSDLRRNIENLENNSVTSLRTLVNLGSEVYMQADVPDTQRVFVDIGLGFHVEFTWAEALNYISLREEKIARQIEEYTRQIASIKAQIKLVCEGIRELLQLPAEKSLPGRLITLRYRYYLTGRSAVARKIPSLRKEAIYYLEKHWHGIFDEVKAHKGKAASDAFPSNLIPP